MLRAQNLLPELSKAELLENLESGELPTELLVLVELTGKLEYLDRWAHHITGPAPWEHDFPADAATEIRTLLADAILDAPPEQGDDATIRQLLDHCCGSPVTDQHDMILKEMGLISDEVVWTETRPNGAEDFHVIVIGAGPSGIAAGRRLKRLGVGFTILEAAPEVGGTWLLNTYPGCGVDIASHYFSYSFAANAHWSRYYAKQPEILDYLQTCARDAGILPHVRLNSRVTSAAYDEADHRWTITARDRGRHTFSVHGNVVISAAGLLGTPHIPAYEGLAEFTGTIVHSAQWNPEISVAGKRVALVGSGASANQIGPTVAPLADQLTVYQRTAHWNVGVPNYGLDVTDGERWLLAHIPAYARWFRARTLLSQNDVNRPAQIVDPAWPDRQRSISAVNDAARRELTDYIRAELGDRGDLLPHAVPDYPPFSKRILRDNGWYRMLRRPNVELVPGRDLRFDRDAIIGPDGVRRPTDVAILATGFQASRMLASYEVTGRGGVSIRDVWGEDSPRAYLGMAVPGFPNFFIMYGPNTNIGTGGSIIFQAETWSRYIVDAIKTMIEQDWSAVDVRPAATESYNRQLDARLAEMVWSVTPAGTWYRNAAGRVTTNMPWTTFEYWQMTQHVNFSHFDVSERPVRNRPAGAGCPSHAEVASTRHPGEGGHR